MKPDPSLSIQRRDFLKLAAATTALSLTDQAFAAASSNITVVIDADDPHASSASAKWAASQLQKYATEKGATATVISGSSVTPIRNTSGATLLILLAAAKSPLARDFTQPTSTTNIPESFRITPGHLAGAPALWLSATDTRGFVYGLLELSERIRYGKDPATALHITEALEKKPANTVRSVMRCFCSEIEDKPWFYDKDAWRSYLDVLAASRFNRFNLSFGLAYDFPRDVTDDYFHLPYPYLVDVPGYNVRAVRIATHAGPHDPVPLPAAEREKNLEALRFIAAETAARGLEFQLGLWTHAYAWTDSPRAYHRIEGLTPETHAAYCRDALAIILKTCPEISGLTMRVHNESGIAEGSYPFWKALFEAITGSGRTIELDMHAKGVNQIMIDIGIATGMPLKLGAKYSAEHQSLGYQQADIRKQEMPPANISAEDVAKMTLAARSFTRYGYADFLQQGSRTQLLFRLWPGTQRHLLSGDPALAAAFGRTASFCGAAGLELMEPLTFKGRDGSGLPGGRCAYADPSLTPTAGDWQKFEYYYRIWGRHLYNPDADPEGYRRYLRTTFGSGPTASSETPAETALANASRILPLLTSAHLPSASNRSLWIELPTNMPIVPGSEPSPYSDTPTPKIFANVSPLDPQLFSTIAEHTTSLLSSHPSAKYSPIEVAQWLEDLASTSAAALAVARKQATSPNSPEFRRMEEDVLIQIGLARFFAAKMRSATLFAINSQTGHPHAGQQAVAAYKQARETWSSMATRAAKIYVPDITYGELPVRHGHWLDRIAAIDTDIAAMQTTITQPFGATAQPTEESILAAIAAATGKPRRPSTPCTHTPPTAFQPGKPLALSVSLTEPRPSINLLYRHVNQAERWSTLKMDQSHQTYTATIPAGYTQSPYPLQYYFELTRENTAWLYPAFNATLSNQPYFVIWKRDA